MTAYRLLPDAVPAVGERPALVVRAFGGGVQVVPQHPVADHQPAGDPQPARGGLGEQHVDGRGEVRAEHQRGRRAGLGQAATNSPATVRA